jgi:multicomponent Na+:H+ antiporter subunit D
VKPEFWLPLFVLASSFLTGLVIFFIGETKYGLRTILNMTGATLKLVAVAIIFWLTFQGWEFEARFPIALGFDFLIRVDLLSLMFVTLSSVLWFITTIYAIGYLEGSPHRARFFGFFSLCVTASTGIALAGNLVTFFIFYELLTLVTYPLVVHRGTEKSLKAGRTYLWYTITGGTVLFVGVVWMHVIAGPLDFVHTGMLAELGAEHHGSLMVIFAILICGLGVKAALVPLHGWLPVAMVAPAPVSALLHAVAVVKAGAFGLVRVIFDVYGHSATALLELATPLAWLAAVTIIYASIRALAQTDIKRRLAFSTISQVSYITLGAALGGPVAAIGGLVHLVHQGLMKVTLFFCAGNWAETLDIKRIDQLDGVGRRMPWTGAAFTVGALGMIGVPPVAGFITKWYLGTGAVQIGHYWVVVVLVVSTLLNAAYFLPLLHRIWFRTPADNWKEHMSGLRGETRGMLLWPTVFVALCALLAGLFAAAALSPLDWAELIVLQGYGPW